MTIWTKDAWPKEGASIAEAIRRTVWPSHLLNLDHATELLKSAGWPRRVGTINSEWFPLSPVQHRNNALIKQHKRTEAAVIQQFHELLSEGDLVATGFRDPLLTDAIAIKPEAWRHLTWNARKNTARAKRGRQLDIFGVRIFPVLGSAEAVNCLKGLSLKYVFERFVGDDPEFLASVKREDANASYELGYSDGDESPPFDRARCFWNATLPAVEHPEQARNFPDEPSDDRARAARLVVRDRVSALFALLRDDRLFASGHDRAGRRIDLSPAHWRSPRCYVDFETGGFFQFSDMGTPEVFAGGLSLDEAKPSREVIATAPAPVVPGDIDGLPRPLEDEPYKKWVARVYVRVQDAYEKLSPRGEKAKFARILERTAKAYGKGWKFNSLRDSLSSLHDDDKAKRNASAGVRQRDIRIVKK